jgi:transcription termination/antitermination protein NusG
LSGYVDEQLSDIPVRAEDDFQPAAIAQRWHVLWTKSNCEQSVFEQLASGGFDVLLPTVDKWSRRKHARCLYRAPLFPGYLFVRHAMDKSGYIEISKARGLVRILGERWDKLATVPDDEIEAIRKVNQSDLPRMPHPYLRLGQTVRIISGPLANVQGVLVRQESKRGLLVLSIELLRRSLAVEVDCTLVATI